MPQSSVYISDDWMGYIWAQSVCTSDGAGELGNLLNIGLPYPTYDVLDTSD